MDLFGIGPMEMVLIFVIGLLVLGPVRMNKAARNAGKMVRQARSQLRDVDPRRLIEEPLRDALNDASADESDDDVSPPATARRFGKAGKAAKTKAKRP